MDAELKEIVPQSHLFRVRVQDIRRSTPDASLDGSHLWWSAFNLYYWSELKLLQQCRTFFLKNEWPYFCARQKATGMRTPAITRQHPQHTRNLQELHERTAATILIVRPLDRPDDRLFPLFAPQEKISKQHGNGRQRDFSITSC